MTADETAPDSDDPADDKRGPRITRRETLGVLAAAGAIGIGSASSSTSAPGETAATIGGGPMADELGEFRVRQYAMTWSEFQNTAAAVRGRIVKIHDPGNAHHGELYYDDSESWTLTSRKFESVHTERSVTKSEPVYNVKYWGAVGDGSTNDRQAIRDAADAASAVGGTVYFPPGTYGVDGGGSTGDGVGVGIQLPGGVDYQLDEGATIKNLSTPQHCVYFNGADDWTLTGGTIDGASHDSGQSDTTRAHAIAVGYKTPQGTAPDTSTGCADWRIENVTITGGHRHGIETAGGSVRGEVESCLFTDAGADDGISVSGDSKYIWVTDCVARNNFRDIFEGAGFEVDDGPQHIYFENCWAFDYEIGFNVLKTHPNVFRTTEHNYLTNCVAVNCGTGFLVDPIGDFTHSHGRFIGCRAHSCTTGFRVATHDTTANEVWNVTFEGCEGYNADAVFQFAARSSGSKLTVKMSECYAEGAAVKTIDSTGDGEKDLEIRNSHFANPSGSNVSHLLTSGAGLLSLNFVNNTVEGATNNALNFGGGINNYRKSFVRNNEFENNTGTPMMFAANGVRNRVITIDNGHWSDASPTAPENAISMEGMYYLDDGTNTVSGTAGYRVYLAGAWMDWVTA